MTIQQAIIKLINRENLTATEMQDAMRQIMQNEATEAQKAAFLVAMRVKGETVVELTTAAKMMLQLMVPVVVNKPHLVDVVGTGGDGAHTFNISTASSIVAAAAGAFVARHGNRSVSSTSGTADVLSRAGVNLELSAEQVARCIEEVGIGFIFAPLYHPAMKAVAAVRKELGVRTFLNLLGPLVNPAKTPHLLLGVFSKEWLMRIAQVALELNYQHVLVVHSEDGLDEISIAAPTSVAELRNQEITTYTITPEQFGLKRGNLRDIRVENSEQSLKLIEDVLSNKDGMARDVVLLNAGAALYVAGIVKDIASGIKKAATTISSGAAQQKFKDFVAMTKSVV